MSWDKLSDEEKAKYLRDCEEFKKLPPQVMIGDYVCDKCKSPVWVTWEIGTEKPMAAKCYRRDCDGVQRPDPSGQPDKQGQRHPPMYRGQVRF